MADKLSSGKPSLLKLYDLAIGKLSYEHIDTCRDVKELERIIKILRSKEEGTYPHLLIYAEDKLALIDPQNKVLQKEGTLLKKGMVRQDDWNAISDDMKEWAEHIKALDQDLQRTDLKLRELPPVRGSKSKTPTTPVQEIEKPQQVEKPQQEVEKTPPSKVKSCVPRSYSEWDAFDPEKELMKMEIAEEKEKEELAKKKRLSQIDIKDETVEAKRKMVNTKDKDNYDNLITPEKEIMALKEKEKGNEFFHAKDYKNAAICYTASLKLNPTLAAHNNRAMAYLSMENYRGVIEDCDYVLKQEPENIKALWRRGNAYLKLHEHTQGYKDIDLIVRLDPNNHKALNLLKDLRKNLFTDKKTVRIPIQEGDSSKKSQKIMELSSTETKGSTARGNKSYKNAKLTKSLARIVPSSSSAATSETEPSEIFEIRLENSDKPDSYLVPLKAIVPTVNRWGRVRYNCPFRNTSRKTPVWLPERLPKCTVCEIEGRSPEYDCQRHRKPLKIESMEVEESKPANDICLEEENKAFDTTPTETKENSFMELECPADVTDIKYEKEGEKGATDEKTTEKQDITKEQNNKPESVPKTKSKSSSNTVNFTYRPHELRKVNVAKKYEKCRETKSAPVHSEPVEEQTAIVNTEEPCNPFEFTMKWEALKHCTELTEHAKLLSTVKPDELPRALGTKMDGDMLKKILHCLDKYYTNEENAQLLLNYLENLTKVERFSTVLLFLSNPDKKVINKLFDVLKTFNCSVPYHVTKAYFP